MSLVSVIIPTYNRAGLIHETVDSVLAQTYRALEVIVVDDGSKDHTNQVIRSYGDKVVYRYKENGGQASARNLGIQIAQGQYIAFIDSDDLWTPHKLERQMDALLSSQYVWAYCDVELFQEQQILGRYSDSHQPYQHQIAHQLLLDNFIASPSPIVSREVFEQVGYFDEDQQLRSREDWEMWLRIAAAYPVAYIREALARYRVHASNVTRQEDVLTLHRSQLKVLEKALTCASAVYTPVKQRAFAAQFIRTGRALWGQGDIKGARKMFAQAIHCYPLHMDSYFFWVATIVGKQAAIWLRTFNGWRRRALNHYSN